ncbi:MAG: glucose-1-phosphate adenylyltransferase [Planctomycetales bacterium]|nr:glucose-1-phosphate adenylyltransferase [Planctomycetales bacterium]
MDPNKTIALVLAGGAGSRLHPLTKDRAKPAVPFGGKYRIIDFALSNCLHSGIRKILVLTQYKSHSLQMHLRDGWSIFNPGIGEYITVVPPQQRTGTSWYQGTADAVAQNLYLLDRSDADFVVILSGDHIYRMDYAAMVNFCVARNAATAVACMRVPSRDASSFGVLQIDSENRVIDFQEKPEAPAVIPGDEKHSLVSMGIYVFQRTTLCKALKDDQNSPISSHDFGKDILPKLVQDRQVYAYSFGESSGRVTVDGYWRDVGTIDGYFKANMDLLRFSPPLDLYQSNWPIRTSETQAPPARVLPGRSGKTTEVNNVIAGAGTVVTGGSVWNSVLSGNVRVEEGATVKHCVLLDGVTVGEGAKLRNCIVDKNVVIPAGESIGYAHNDDRKRFPVSESRVVVVPKGHDFGCVSKSDHNETVRIASASSDTKTLTRRDVARDPEKHEPTQSQTDSFR